MTDNQVAIPVAAAQNTSNTSLSVTSERIIKAIAVLSSTLAVSYYGVTTEGQPWYVVGSGVGANLFVNTFAAYKSQKHLIKLKQENIKLLVATLAVAIALSAPYGLISYLEMDTDNKLLKMLAPTFSILGSFVINGLALGQLNDEYAKIKSYFYNLFFLNKNNYQLIQNINQNTKTLTQLLKVLDYHLISPVALNGLNEIHSDTEKALAAFTIIFNHSKTAPTPTYVTMMPLLSWIAYGLSAIIKSAFVVAPLFSALAVTCASDVSFQKDLGATPLMGVGFGNLSMLGEDFLSVTGGYALGASFLDLISNLFLYRKIGNNLTALTVCAMLFSIFIAFYSGFTAEKQWGECSDSLMGSFMIFPLANVFANISSAFFNIIYTKSCLIEGFFALKGDNQNDPYYVLEKAIGDVSAAHILELTQSESDSVELDYDQLEMAEKLQIPPNQFNLSLFSKPACGIGTQPNSLVEVDGDEKTNLIVS